MTAPPRAELKPGEELVRAGASIGTAASAVSSTARLRNLAYIQTHCRRLRGAFPARMDP
jgi:hypothetical protein